MSNIFSMERKFFTHYKKAGSEEIDHMTVYTYNIAVPIGDFELTIENLRVQVDKLIRANTQIISEYVSKIRAKYEADRNEKDFEIAKVDIITTFYINDKREPNESIILHDTYTEV